MVLPASQRPAVPLKPKRVEPGSIESGPNDPPRNRWQEFLDRYVDNVESFVREALGAGEDTFNEIGQQISGIFPDQLEFIQAYGRRDRRISKRSGHRVGKTTALAWILVHHAVCRFPQKAVCTAPTSTQLFDALYSETVSWFRKLKPDVQGLFEIKAESVELKSAPTESFISFVTSSADKPEALAGKHSAWVLLLVDEASGVPEAIFEAASGSMAGHNATTILAGNPVRTSGLFFDTHNKPEVMKEWTLFHTSCEGHPNVSPDFLTQMKAQYGEGSNAYRVRVQGEFPKAEANTVISWEHVEAALHRDVKPLAVTPIWGVDVGLSQDPSCIAKRKGNVLLEPTEEFQADDDLMKVVAWVKRHWDETLPSQRPQDINIDYIGMGAGVVHRLLELGLPARGVNVSESASMGSQFMRLRSELWWKGREWFAKKDCNIADDRLLGAELILPIYKLVPGGKLVVESKRDTKIRKKTLSPNRADSFLLTLASEAITAAGADAKPLNWKEPLAWELKGIV